MVLQIKESRDIEFEMQLYWSQWFERLTRFGDLITTFNWCQYIAKESKIVSTILLGSVQMFLLTSKKNSIKSVNYLNSTNTSQFFLEST